MFNAPAGVGLYVAIIGFLVFFLLHLLRIPRRENRWPDLTSLVLITLSYVGCVVGVDLVWTVMSHILDPPIEEGCIITIQNDGIYVAIGALVLIFVSVRAIASLHAKIFKVTPIES